MRYLIYGAGAVGGAIGARLFQAGHEVTLAARGAHLEAIRSRGLEVVSAEGRAVLPIPVLDSPPTRHHHDDLVVLVATKTQDTAAALARLESVVGPDTPVVCAQNGVENERLAVRRFANVYAMCVMLPATHLEPGVVEVNSSPVTGILDLGRYPSGVDDRAVGLASDLEGATFSSRPDPQIMRRKYTKLLMNLGNALEAACGAGARTHDLYRRAKEEGVRCLESAGIDFASDEEDRARRGDLLRVRPEGRAVGGSSSQSLARGTGSIEADYLNGEVVMLGRLFGVPTPVNEALRRAANRMAAEHRRPGSMAVEELLAEIDAGAGRA